MISAFRMGPATSGRRLCDIDSVLFGVTTVGCIFPMVISSEFHMGQHRDDDHREDTLHFKSLVRKIGLFDFNKVHSKQDRIIDYVCSYQVYFHRTRTSYFYDMCFSNFE